jgi:hypothetical protein
MKIKYIIPLIFAGTVTVACTDLSENFYSVLPSDEFFSDPEMLEVYAGNAYASLQNYCTEQSLWTLNMISSDECCVPTNQNGSWAEPRYGELQKHTFPVSNKLIRTGWDFCFTGGIASCNEAISAINKAADFTDKAHLLAEMRVLRALYYFWACDGWGNIPFSIDADDKSLPEQKNRAFIYDFILDEINDCIDELDATPTAANYGRVTQGMAYTLLAKLYLNAEEWIGQAKWSEAAQACQAVINAGNYTIEERYKKNFEVGNETSRENIFAIPYSNIYTYSDQSAFTLHFFCLDAVNAEKFNITASPWNGFVCQPDFFALYDRDRDTRCADTWLFGQQYDHAGNPVADWIIDPDFGENKFTGGSPGRRADTDGAKIWKWTYQDDGSLIDADNMVGMANHFAIFRYADVLYMYAEALLRGSGDASAALNMPDFQKIRTRAGLAPFDAVGLTLDALLTERGVEFAWEGWRRNDLIRFGKYNDPWWAKPVASPDSRKIYPIPYERLSVNGLTQNPGYSE